MSDADKLVLRAGIEAEIQKAQCDCTLDGEICLADLARHELQKRLEEECN